MPELFTLQARQTSTPDGADAGDPGPAWTETSVAPLGRRGRASPGESLTAACDDRAVRRASTGEPWFPRATRLTGRGTAGSAVRHGPSRAARSPGGGARARASAGVRRRP